MRVIRTWWDKNRGIAHNLYSPTNKTRMAEKRAFRGGYTKSQAARNRKRNYAKGSGNEQPA